jgi:hypothetical protein
MFLMCKQFFKKLIQLERIKSELRWKSYGLNKFLVILISILHLK